MWKFLIAVISFGAIVALAQGKIQKRTKRTKLKFI